MGTSTPSPWGKDFSVFFTTIAVLLGPFKAAGSTRAVHNPRFSDHTIPTSLSLRPPLSQLSIDSLKALVSWGFQ